MKQQSLPQQKTEVRGQFVAPGAIPHGKKTPIPYSIRPNMEMTIILSPPMQ